MPTFKQLWENHPEISDSEKTPCKRKNGEKAFPNQCSIRLGTCFRKAGIDTSLLAQKGAELCWYHNKTEAHIIRAEQLAIALTKVNISGFGPVQKLTPIKDVEDFDEILGGNTGVIFLKDYYRRESLVNGQVVKEKFINRSGDHIDLWNGSRLTSLSSWFRIQWGLNWGSSDMKQSREIWFWEVK